jgi:hypothetical protein
MTLEWLHQSEIWSNIWRATLEWNFNWEDCVWNMQLICVLLTSDSRQYQTENIVCISSCTNAYYFVAVAYQWPSRPLFQLCAIALATEKLLSAYFLNYYKIPFLPLGPYKEDNFSSLLFDLASVSSFSALVNRSLHDKLYLLECNIV